jgi:hypothetical protein
LKLHPLHPDSKPQFKDGDEVEFTPDGSVDSPIYSGRIVGRATSPDVIDNWIILLDAPIPEFEWSAVCMPHTLIRRKGSNEPFSCRWLNAS